MKCCVVKNLHELHGFMVTSFILSKKIKTHDSTKIQSFFFVFSSERSERVVEKILFFFDRFSGVRFRSKISSRNWRSDLGLICAMRLSKVAGIVSYFEDFVIEDRAKTA